MAASAAAATKSKTYPSLVVFDLDDCIWSPEMYTLSVVPKPKDAIMGDLNGKGKGVIGVRSGGEVIKIFPGALRALQEIHAGKYPGPMRLATASSAETPRAVKIGRAAMNILEVVPGVSFKKLLLTHGGGFGDERNLKIGRTPPLSSNKSTTHFPQLRRDCGIPYDEMLFFDDCNWTDHCTIVARVCKGVVTQRTPHGLTFELWTKALEKYALAHK